MACTPVARTRNSAQFVAALGLGGLGMPRALCALSPFFVSFVPFVVKACLHPRPFRCRLRRETPRRELSKDGPHRTSPALDYPQIGRRAWRPI